LFSIPQLTALREAAKAGEFAGVPTKEKAGRQKERENL
jgi:hypothetical protein